MGEHELEGGVRRAARGPRWCAIATSASSSVGGRGAARSTAAMIRSPSRSTAVQEEVLLAAEVAVDRGPGAAGLPRDVVERRLGHAVAGEADERGVEDPVFG